MDSASIAAVLVAIIGAVQVVMLAKLSARQQTIAKNVDGALSRAQDERATDVELADRESNGDSSK